MSDKPVIAVFAGDPAQRAYIADLLPFCGALCAKGDAEMATASLAIATADSVPASRPDSQTLLLLGGGERDEAGVRVLPVPLRAADLLQAIERHFMAGRRGPTQITIAGRQLDTQESLWLEDGKEPLRLTEKEVAILCYLKESEPLPVSREVLLEKVWAYADGVQTHTLETHIYRLRQKIEHDPSAPEILLTVEDGYRLGV